MIRDPQVGESYWLLDPMNLLPVQALAVRVLKSDFPDADTMVVLSREKNITSRCFASYLFDTEKACAASRRKSK